MSSTAPPASVTFTLDGSNRSTTLPLLCGTVGPDVVDIRKLYAELGIFTFDPGYGETASCESKITYIDGDEGVLLYRGYPIEQLAEKSDFIEVCYLLMNGDLPNAGAARGVPQGRHLPHDGARAAAPLLRRLPPRRAPDGGDVRRGRRAGRLLPRQPRHQRPAPARDRGLPPDRQGADHRGLGLQVRARPALHVSAQRPRATRRTSSTCSTPCRRSPTSTTRSWRARWTASWSCTRTTSRTPRPRRCAWRARPAPTPSPASPPASPRSGARRMAAPTRRC